MRLAAIYIYASNTTLGLWCSVAPPAISFKGCCLLFKPADLVELSYEQSLKEYTKFRAAREGYIVHARQAFLTLRSDLNISISLWCALLTTRVRTQLLQNRRVDGAAILAS